MTASVINILDMVEEVGIDATEAILADFSTRRSDSEEPLNEDIEVFLKGIPCEPVRHDTFTGEKMTFFHDPDGLPIEIHE